MKNLNLRYYVNPQHFVQNKRYDQQNLVDESALSPLSNYTKTIKKKKPDQNQLKVKALTESKTITPSRQSISMTRSISNSDPRDFMVDTTIERKTQH